MKSFKNISHLGLVSGTARFLKIIEFIDARIPKNSNNQKLSHGEIFVCMIVNALSFTTRPMYLSSKFFKTMDLDHLLGKKIECEWLNDDAIGRTLDALFEYGISELYMQMAAEAFNMAGIKYRIGHLDSTSIHYHGNSYEEPAYFTIDNKLTETPIVAALGYSRDAHPELKQVMLQMISDTVSGSPLFMKPQDGNTNDTKGFNPALELVSSMKGALALDYLVADAAMYSADNLLDAQKYNVKIITRAPQKIKEVGLAVKEANKIGFTDIDENYSGCFIDSCYGGIPQKWLVIHSVQADSRAIKTIDNKVKKELEKQTSELNKLSKQEFNCEPDAVACLAKFQKKLKLIKVSNFSIREEKKFSTAGRHKKGEQPDVSKYYIDAVLEKNQEIIDIEKQECGCFVIATNDIAKEWEMAELLYIYKDQQKVERGFRFLKSPRFFADSLFIKTPHRIEALLMIMVSSLLVYSLSEYMLRKNLKAKSAYVPSQTKKPTNKPTMSWVYDLFMNIGTIQIDEEMHYTTLEPEQITVIQCLGYPWLDVYHDNLNQD